MQNLLVNANQSVIAEPERDELLSKFSLIGDMSASIAHEVRNPMTTVRGLAQLLAAEHPEKASYYQLMIEEIDRANEMLSQFLSLSAHCLRRADKVAVDKVIEKVIHLLKPQMSAQGITVIADLMTETMVYGDEDRLKQMFYNILKNAVEASSPGDQILITSRVSKSRLYVCIIDQGTGIDSQLAEQIIDPFFTTKDNSAGLGLSVAYKIVRDHNGDLCFDSCLDLGSTVRVSLPLIKDQR